MILKRIKRNWHRWTIYDHWWNISTGWSHNTHHLKWKCLWKTFSYFNVKKEREWAKGKKKEEKSLTTYLDSTTKGWSCWVKHYTLERAGDKMHTDSRSLKLFIFFNVTVLQMMKQNGSLSLWLIKIFLYSPFILVCSVCPQKSQYASK